MPQLPILESSAPASPSTSTPAASPPGGEAPPASLGWPLSLAAMVILAGTIAAIGWVLERSRSRRSGSVVRSWIALSLVAGLLIFCALAFALKDSTLRSTLVGALTAAVGSGTAFYFSSKSTEQANQLLTASVGGEVVPYLKGKSQADAEKLLSVTSLKLVTAPDSPPPNGRPVEEQDPPAGTTVPKGTSVSVTYGPSEQSS